jgi:homoserine acetyltransferase
LTVIVVAMLGNGESTSPSNDTQFPTDYSLRYQDSINAQYALVTQNLGLKSLEAVIGFSMGGQQAYYWAVMHGSGTNPFLKNAVVICGSAKTSGHNYTFLEGPISALESSSDYEEGKYRVKSVYPSKGIQAFGRAYAAWLTSPAWFREELWREWLSVGSLKEWLYPADGDGNFESWDAEDLLTLARQWQAGDVGVVGGDGNYQKALQEIMARVLVMPCMTDQYFDWKDGENEVKYLKYGIFMPIPSIWGHIAGGGANKVDIAWMDEKIKEFLRGI